MNKTLIAVNLPNLITITLMALLGLLVWGLVAQGVRKVVVSGGTDDTVN